MAEYLGMGAYLGQSTYSGAEPGATQHGQLSTVGGHSIHYGTNKIAAAEFDSEAASALSIGTTNATSITIGKSTVNTIIAGDLTVNGTTFTSKSETVLVSDNFLHLNYNFNTGGSVQSGGIVSNVAPVANTQGNIASITQATRTVTIAAAPLTAIAVGDLIVIEGTVDNDGIYEILTVNSTTSFVVQSNSAMDFIQNSFAADGGAVGTLTKVAVGAAKVSDGTGTGETIGEWYKWYGSSTVGAGATDWSPMVDDTSLQEAYVKGNTITTSVGEGIFSVSGTQQISLASSSATADAIKLNTTTLLGGIDIDASTGGITIDTTGAFSIDGEVSPSNVSNTQANLTISTITSGTLFVSSAGILDLDAGTNATGSLLSINAGIGTAGNGGAVTINAGDSTGDATSGGAILLEAGSGVLGNVNGGSVTIRAGNASGSGTVGSIYIGESKTREIYLGNYADDPRVVSHNQLDIDVLSTDASASAYLRLTSTDNVPATGDGDIYNIQSLQTCSNTDDKGYFRFIMREAGGTRVATEVHLGEAGFTGVASLVPSLVFNGVNGGSAHRAVGIKYDPDDNGGMFVLDGITASSLGGIKTKDRANATDPFRVWTGNATTSGNTGLISLQTGNATSGNSGDITLETGTASGTKGKIDISGTRMHLDAHANNVSLRIPTWNTTGNPSAVTPVSEEGDIVVNTADDTFQYYASGSWHTLDPTAVGVSGLNTNYGIGDNTLAMTTADGPIILSDSLWLNTDAAMIFNDDMWLGFGSDSDGLIYYTTDYLAVRTKAAAAAATSAINIGSGNCSSAGALSSGGVTISSGSVSGTIASGTVVISTGASSSTGVSGNLDIKTGSSSSNTGNISLITGESTGATGGSIYLTGHQDSVAFGSLYVQFMQNMYLEIESNEIQLGTNEPAAGQLKLAWGGAPVGAAAGYGTGTVWIDATNGVLYINTGNSTSATWVKVGTQS